MANRKKTRGSKRRKRKDRCRSKRRKRGGTRAIESGWLKEGGDRLLRNRLIGMANQIILTWEKNTRINSLLKNITTPQLIEAQVLLVDKIIETLGGRSGVYKVYHIIMDSNWKNNRTTKNVLTSLGKNMRLAHVILSAAQIKFPGSGAGAGGGGGGGGGDYPVAPSEAIQVGDVTIFADGTRVELPSVEGLSAAAAAPAAVVAAAAAQPVAILANPSGSGGRRRRRRRRKRTQRLRRKSRRKRSTRQY